MDALQKRKILEAYYRRKLKPALYRALFKEQQDFADDPSMLLSALTDRRAGKSNAMAAKLYFKAEEYPNSICPYIALTYWSAENILWPVMKEMNEKFSLGMQLKEASLTAELKNGARIPLMGANTKDFMEKLRGPKYPMVGIDEAASFKSHLKPMVEEILLPAVSDYNGQVAMVGTPGPIPSGYFYEATMKLKAWKVHRWSWRNNPYLPNQAAFVKKMMELQGWDENHPTYLREWCGKWVVDQGALVYKFSRDRNVYSKLPDGIEWYRVLGIDFGYNDATAFSILSYSPNHPTIFIERSEGHKELIPSQIAKRTMDLRERFSPNKIVADTGGLGKSICQEMIQRYHIPIEAAEKREKFTNIALMNGDFIDQNLMVHDSQTLLMDQMETLAKDINGMEDPNLPNDLCDSTLYAYRYCKHYAWTPKTPPIDQNSEKWAEKYWEKEEEKLQRAESEENWGELSGDN